MSIKGGSILLLAAIVIFVAVSFFVTSGPGPGSRNYIPESEQQAAAPETPAQEPAVETPPAEEAPPAAPVVTDEPVVSPPPAEAPVTSEVPPEAPAGEPADAMPGEEAPGSEGMEGTPPEAAPEQMPEQTPEQTGEAVQPAPAGEAPACDFAMWVGQPVNEEAVKATGRPYRILPPGSMATMDYSAERINVHTDDAGTVTEVTCG